MNWYEQMHSIKQVKWFQGVALNCFLDHKRDATIEYLRKSISEAEAVIASLEKEASVTK